MSKGSIIKLTCPRCKNTFEYILPQKIPRTLRQNRWYWSCVVGIPAEHYGYLPEEMHEAYKWMFLRRFEEDKPNTVKSTTSLDTKEFTEYIEKCRCWAAQEGFNIPSPEEMLAK